MVKRNLNIDLMRVVATWLIVISHVVTNVTARPDFFGGKSWWVAHMIYSLTIPATPLFFMMSGYLAGRKKRSVRENVVKTWNRLWVPFIVFTLLNTVVYNAIELRITWQQFVANLMYGGRTHLYFLLGLGVLHLLNPWFWKLKDDFSRQEKNWFAQGLMMISAMLILVTFLVGRRELLFLSFSYWFLVMGFYWYGISAEFRGRKSEFGKKSLGMWLAALVFLAVVTYGLMRAGRFNVAEYFQSYLSIPMMVISVGLFEAGMRVKFVAKLKKEWRGVLLNLSRYSYGVYLVHMMVLELVLQRTPLTPYNSDLPLMMFLVGGMGVTLGASYGVSWIWNQIPYLRLAMGDARDWE